MDQDQPLAPVPELALAFVDDSLIMRLVWQRAELAGFAVEVFKSPEEFMASTRSFDAVVTDYNFDGSPNNGHDLALWVRAHRPKMRVIVCSNQDDIDQSAFDGSVSKEKVPTAEVLRGLVFCPVKS